jgi:hypothetical protein
MMTDELAADAAQPDTVEANAGAAGVAPSDSGAKPDAAVNDGADKPLIDGGGKDVEAAAPATWPDDWRQRLAGEDKKALKTLERMTDPGQVFKAYSELREKVSSGEYKRVPPKDATPEDLAAWRKEAGLPEKPEDYDVALPDGIVMGEADKPIFDSFKPVAHAANMTTEQMNAAADWYFKMQQQLADEQDDFDLNFRKTAEDSLREEWGNDYRRNVNAISGAFSSAPEGLKERFLKSRIPVMDEKGNVTGMAPLGNDPDVVKWLASMALEINPASTIAPGSPSASMTSIKDEIAAIEKRMSEDRAGYFKDEAMQNRYRQLLEAQDKLGSRAA